MTGQRIATPLPFSLAACVALLDACQRAPTPPAPTDAALTADAANARTSRGRRRRTRGPSGALAAGAQQGSRTSPAGSGASDNQGDDLAGVDDPGPETPAPAQRPRITERGPILPENVERPANVEYDLGASGAQGPMGLEPPQISAGLNPLLPRLQVCAAATTDDSGHGPHGRVSVRLRIHNDGNPVAARVTGGGGPPEFLPCVRRVVASARFARFSGPEVLASWGFDL